MGHRDRLENEPVDEAEKRCVGAYAEGEREDRDEGEARRRPKAAPGIDDIVSESLHCVP